jgi:putative transposase
MAAVTGLVREALYETVIEAGLACVDEVLEAKRVALCGELDAHLVDREAARAGHVASSLVLGGRRVAVTRPRVRSTEGHTNSSYRAGKNGVRVIRYSSARSSRWC